MELDLSIPILFVKLSSLYFLSVDISYYRTESGAGFKVAKNNVNIKIEKFTENGAVFKTAHL